MYDAGTAATLAIVSTGTNTTATATHIDGVSIADGLTGATVTFTGTTVDAVSYTHLTLPTILLV